MRVPVCAGGCPRGVRPASRSVRSNLASEGLGPLFGARVCSRSPGPSQEYSCLRCVFLSPFVIRSEFPGHPMLPRGSRQLASIGQEV